MASGFGLNGGMFLLLPTPARVLTDWFNRRLAVLSLLARSPGLLRRERERFPQRQGMRRDIGRLL